MKILIHLYKFVDYINKHDKNLYKLYKKYTIYIRFYKNCNFKYQRNNKNIKYYYKLYKIVLESYNIRWCPKNNTRFNVIREFYRFV